MCSDNTSKTDKIVNLHEEDIERILEVEGRAFIPPLQASRETILRRIRMNHIYLGAESDCVLIGTLAFRDGRFDLASFPKSAHQYADAPNDADPNAIFVYSLGVIPESRGNGHAIKLIEASYNYVRTQGIQVLIGEGRFPSYNGSIDFPQEKIKKIPGFKEIIDTGLITGTLPKKQDLIQDNLLNFYSKCAGIDFLFLVANFCPDDKSTGGHRIFMCRAR